MKKAIYKYQIGHASCGDHVANIQVPKSSQFLHVGVQDGEIWVWYMVDPNETEERYDCWQQIGTGHKYEEVFFGEYKGSLIVEKYGMVWHMFVKENT